MAKMTKKMSTEMKQATARAHSNIALVKYWGKRDRELNLPAVGSISLTLKELFTTTTVRFRPDLPADRLLLNGKEAGEPQTRRIGHFLDRVRRMAGISEFAEVISENNFPTGAGLASSASAFASLALAGSRAAGLRLSSERLSELARLGSGSAARSVFGGFVEMKTGERDDGSDAVAVPLADAGDWDLRLIIAITSRDEKKTGSTEGMNHTARTSPFYNQWIYSSAQDLEAARLAIFAHNFRSLGEIAEHSCLKMHALAMSARPGIIYWKPATVALMRVVRQLRESGIPAYFTIDAGPQVKVLCQPQHVAEIIPRLKDVPGVLDVMVASPGPGARLIEDESP